MAATDSPTRSLTSYGSDAQALGTGTHVRGLAVVPWVAGYVRPYRGRFALMVVLTLLSSGLKVGGLLFIKPFCDIILGTFSVDAYGTLPFLRDGLGRDWLVQFADLLSGRPRAALFILIGLVGGTMLLQATAALGAAYFQNYLGGRVGMDVQRDLVDRLLMQPVAFFAERGKGELVNVVSSDSFALYRTFYVFFDRIVRGVIEAGGALALAVALDWRLTLMAGAVLGPTVLILRQFTRHMRKRERVGYHFSGVYGLIIQEFLASPLVIKAFQLEDYFATRLEWARRKQFRRYMSLNKVRAWMTPLVEIVVAIVLGAFIYYNGTALMSGRLEVSRFVLLYACLGALVGPIRKGAKGYGELIVNTQMIYRVLDLMGRVPAIKDRDGAIALPPVQGRIEFQDVRFSYGEGQPAVDGVTVTIEPGERVALVGPSGAGKSTLAALLLRLYDPDSGLIRIDGYDIQDVQQQSLRRQIGFVTQSAVLFSDTVRMNITCGVAADDAAVEAAARAARAHEFIMQLPHGYDTDLGDMGTDLSGGQRQRLVVARCLFRNTPIVVLDEATSSLDAIAEAELQEEIEMMASGRTTIIIAHRFSTILNADRLILLNEGRVEGIGTHVELYADNHLYRELFERQMLVVDGNDTAMSVAAARVSPPATTP